LPHFRWAEKKKEGCDKLRNLFSKRFWKSFWRDQGGMGVVEVILIIVVLISLVIIFKTQITEVVNDIFKKIVSQSSSI